MARSVVMPITTTDSQPHFFTEYGLVKKISTPLADRNFAAASTVIIIPPTENKLKTTSGVGANPQAALVVMMRVDIVCSVIRLPTARLASSNRTRAAKRRTGAATSAPTNSPQSPPSRLPHSPRLHSLAAFERRPSVPVAGVALGPASETRHSLHRSQPFLTFRYPTIEPPNGKRRSDRTATPAFGPS